MSLPRRNRKSQEVEKLDKKELQDVFSKLVSGEVSDPINFVEVENMGWITKFQLNGKKPKVVSAAMKTTGEVVVVIDSENGNRKVYRGTKSNKLPDKFNSVGEFKEYLERVFEKRKNIPL